MYDLIIIGAGPAGLTAGIYAKRANLKTLILEKETIGGQISSSPLVENYPGFNSISGIELANNFFEQAINLGCDFEIEEVQSIIDGNIKKVITDSCVYESKSIIIATGSKHRKLDLISDNFDGIHYCATCDGAFYKNRKVAVIGGANSAVQNALYLSNICDKVYLICRKNKLKAESALIDRIKTKPNVVIIYNSNVKEVVGNPIEKIVLDNGDMLNIDGLFISIGMSANTEFLNGLLSLTKNNYIISDDCTTKIKGIFVSGDCRDKSVRQVTTAVNDGTVAAMAVIKYLEAEN